MRRRRESISPDLTPLIDVVFLLLVFFLVASVFDKDETVLDLLLPETKSGIARMEKGRLLIELGKTELAVNGKVCKLAELEDYAAAREDKEKPVQLRIDAETEYRRISAVLDILQSFGLQNINLVNLPKAEPGSE